ncbi:hypothetical protein ABL841_09210 [Variovorax paradoxus]|uniref:hypothetical protein n=1 Tax=Variovorax paradoxus TaxID=34073 RepID=UPI00035F7647|nr:hypothetical protein [Variovorax paradoxus]
MRDQVIDESFLVASVIILKGDDLLMVTTYPGQPERVMATPKHIARQLRNGKTLASVPFHREATCSEYADYLREHGLNALDDV